MGFDPKSFIQDYLDEARPLGKANELSWLDFKLEWHQMKTDEGKLEFLKDIAALANTGQDALLVLGVEDKSFAFKDQRIGASNYLDASSFQSLVASRISPSFSLEVGELEYDDGKAKHALSFLHVSPTRNRPHLVTDWEFTPRVKPGQPPPQKRQFRNALFFRRGTETFGPQRDRGETPTRTELDAMYFDRPVAFSRIGVQYWTRRKAQVLEDKGAWRVRLPLVITNLGRIDTSIIEAAVGGKLLISESAPHGHPAVVMEIPDAKCTVALFDQGGQDHPIRLVAGDVVRCAVEVQLWAPTWHGGLLLHHGQRRIEARIRVFDIFGTEAMVSLPAIEC